MPTPEQEDFPKGHPARFDYDPESPEAKEWARIHIHPKGERDFPVGHPKAFDTPGNRNHIPVRAGVDPEHPEREAHTGRTPEQAKAAADVYRLLTEQAKESPAPVPTIALAPPREIGVQRAMQVHGREAVLIFCPGCECGHELDRRWTFNGSYELPTFTPSVCFDGGDGKPRCHSFITNGRIQFLTDSGHSLSGQTVDLPPVAAAQETIHA